MVKVVEVKRLVDFEGSDMDEVVSKLAGRAEVNSKEVSVEKVEKLLGQSLGVDSDTVLVGVRKYKGQKFMFVFDDPDNPVVAILEGQVRFGSGKRGGVRGEKTKIVLDTVQKLINQRGVTTIGEVMNKLGKGWNRPFVFNVVRKYCVFEYGSQGKKRVIMIKGIKNM